MSHYTVLVIGDNVEEKLAPYNENIEVPHTISKDELIAKGKESIENYANGYIWTEWLKNPEAYKEVHSKKNKSHIEYLENGFPEKLEWDDEQIYQNELKWYDKKDINEDGSINSTYNPKSKWDWYQVGGRWSGLLYALPGETGERGEKSWTNETEKQNNIQYDSLLKNQIDWDREEMKNFRTFAVIDRDGNWSEEGEMGWFGCSTTTDDNWEETFKKIIEDIEEDERITIVDCHI